MTERLPAPGRLKRGIDQTLIPAAVNLAGRIEGALMRASERTRCQPVTALLAALVCGYLVRGTLRRL
jgi:hypothetical protein